jgi:hypothetical protein
MYGHEHTHTHTRQASNINYMNCRVYSYFNWLQFYTNATTIYITAPMKLEIKYNNTLLFSYCITLLIPYNLKKN